MTRQETILIVDDDPIARDLLEGFLSKEGYHLEFATSGAGVLGILGKVAPDVILLDVMMPDIDGFELCQRLKASQRWRHIPIILVTALGGKEDLVRGLEAGADDFLHKPVNGLELRARVRSMLRIKKQYDDLQTSMRLREDLARMLVHDFRNPLSVILGYSGLLEARPDISIEELKRGLKQIKMQAVRLSGFLNDMLLLAKMESNQPILHCSEVDINSLVQKVVESHKIIARSNRIQLTVDLPGTSRRLVLDDHLFQRVLDNLISNALKFSPRESKVSIQVEYPAPPAESQLRLTVLDEGPGIPEEHRERIFDKYEIVALKQKDVPQVGLGLAFCKMVVEAHGGRIFMQPNDPTGVAFIVEI